MTTRAESTPLSQTAPESEALTQEWLETDGRGGFASGTRSLCATRRYHGWLVAPLPGTTTRHVWLSRFDEELRTADRSLRTSMARYRGGTLDPRGDLLTTSFQAEPWPRWGVGDAQLGFRRDLLMPKGRAAILIRYTVRSQTPFTLLLRPLSPCREADALTMRNAVLDPNSTFESGRLSWQPYAAHPRLTCTITVSDGSADRSDAGEIAYDPAPVWYEGIEYEQEEARGYDCHEDQFSPGTLEIRGPAGETEILIAVALDRPIPDPRNLFERLSRVRRAAAQIAESRSIARPPSKIRSRLDARADDFVQIDDAGRMGLCAGYPWFKEWGRDTFLSLPGLTLCRGREEQCARVLEESIPFLHDGLLPNVFGTEIADSHYGSADASLWFLRAVDLYRDVAGRGIDPILRPAVEEILSAYTEGTDLGIGLGPDDLLRAGREDLNATWMDAQAPEGPVTPRVGTPVELQALLVAGYGLAAEMAEAAGDLETARSHETMQARLGKAFVEHFWITDPEGDFLADRVERGQAVAEVRPNMVLAAAMRRVPLDREQREAVVARCERDLLTPVGLRTLSPADPRYRERYEGDQPNRDRAYHQGTVWPWLFGFFVEAALRARGERGLEDLRSRLDAFAPELDRRGLGHVSEVFDAEPPHAPGGTIAQAWSTAELLRGIWLCDRESEGHTEFGEPVA